MQTRRVHAGWIALMAVIATTSSYAHTGLYQPTGFWQGLSHPLTGVDHLLAMLAVGIWAMQLGGRAVWLVPASFVSVTAISAVAAMAGITLPLVEPGIVLSVLLLGLLIAAMVRLPLAIGAALVGVLATFHGAAHGMAVPVVVSGAAYAAGLVAATALLHVVGIGLGGLLARAGRLDLVRYLGGAVTLVGAHLALT